MANILETLSTDSFYKYYGKGDLSTNLILSKIDADKDKILSHFNDSYDNDNIDINIFIDYIWIHYVLGFEEVLDEIKNNESFILMFDKLKQINFDIKNVNSFIKNEYKNILNKENCKNKLYCFDLLDFTIETIYKYFDYFDREVFEYIEKNLAYLIVRKIEVCENYYNRNPKYFIDIFELENNKHLFEVQNINNTFENLSKSKKEYIKSLLYQKAEEALKSVIKLAEEINEDNYLENFTWIERVLDLIKNNNFKFLELYKIDELEEKLKITSEKYFKKHGKQFSFGPINLKEMFDTFKERIKTENSFLTYLGLTHSYKKEYDKIVSNFVSIYNSEPAITDIIASVSGTDDYFLSSRLMHLNFYIQLHVSMIYMLLNDDETEDFIFRMLVTQLNDIDTNEAEGKLELVSYFKGLYPTLKESILGQEKDYDETYKFKAISVSMVLISLIEKILRRVAINLSSNIRYYSIDDLNLGSLLRTKNSNGTDFKENTLLTVLDIELIRTLEYTLIKTHDTNIGMNIRNNLMHNRNIKFSELTNGFSAHIFLMFLSTVNGIYANYINHNMKQKKKTKE